MLVKQKKKKRHQIYGDTRCYLEDWPKTTTDQDEYQKRVKGILLSACIDVDGDNCTSYPTK